MYSHPYVHAYLLLFLSLSIYIYIKLKHEFILLSPTLICYSIDRSRLCSCISVTSLINSEKLDSHYALSNYLLIQLEYLLTWDLTYTVARNKLTRVQCLHTVHFVFSFTVFSQKHWNRFFKWTYDHFKKWIHN